MPTKAHLFAVGISQKPYTLLDRQFVRRTGTIIRSDSTRVCFGRWHGPRTVPAIRFSQDPGKTPKTARAF